MSEEEKLPEEIIKKEKEEEKEKINLEKDEDEEEKVYEISFLFIPLLDENSVQKKFESIKDFIISLGGKYLSEGIPSLISLAYEMRHMINNKYQKFSQAYFGWVKFAFSPSKIFELKEKLKFDQEIIRFLIIKTVVEDTLKSKSIKKASKIEEKIETKKIKENEEKKKTKKKKVSEEEIDKKLEELLV